MKEHKKGVAAVSSEIIPYRVAHQMTLIHDHEITTSSESAIALSKRRELTVAVGVQRSEERRGFFL